MESALVGRKAFLLNRMVLQDSSKHNSNKKGSILFLSPCNSLRLQSRPLSKRQPINLLSKSPVKCSDLACQRASRRPSFKFLIKLEKECFLATASSQLGRLKRTKALITCYFLVMAPKYLGEKSRTENTIYMSTKKRVKSSFNPEGLTEDLIFLLPHAMHHVLFFGMKHLTANERFPALVTTHADLIITGAPCRG